MRVRLIMTVFVLSPLACGGSSAGSGSATDAATTDAAGQSDAGAADSAGQSDAGAADTLGQSDAAQSDAAAADAGKSDAPQGDAGAACTYPDAGKCEGATILLCEEGQDTTYDCAAAFKAVGEATCAVIAPDWGADCAMKPGQECLYEGDDGAVEWAFCTGEAPGCVIQSKGVACQEKVGACTAADVETCKDGKLVLDCAASQPYLIDCKELGGACAKSGATFACTGLPAGASCDTTQALCATGLTCEGASATEDGTCTKK